MLRCSLSLRFRMRMGSMFVDYKVLSRDHKRSLRVEEALVDPSLPVTVMPLSWLEQLRSPSVRLPSGFHTEEAVYSPPGYPDSSRRAVDAAKAKETEKATEGERAANAIRAGPVVLYITGQSVPVVLNPLFVCEKTWGPLTATAAPSARGEGDAQEWDLRVGMDAIEQCTLYSELRPGGLLYSKLPSHKSLAQALEPTQEILSRYGMKCGLAESPLVPRPWTRMRYMFIDELQRGPKLTEFVGHNPRDGTPWRFSQHNKYFRQGIWKETIRRNEFNEGLHVHSSWQKSPQQSVPEVSFLAPFP